MSGPNHIAGGIVFTGIYLSMWNINIFSQPLYLGATAFFALLPDIDHTKSLIGKPFWPIARYLDRKFGHRTITHSLLCYFILYLTIGMLCQIWAFEKVVLPKIFLWAYGSHLLLDMVTIQGVPLLYPFKKNPCVIPGNPKFRFRSLDFKVESIAFVLFVMLMFTCKDLFAHGFWNTYDKAFATLKSINAESRLSPTAVIVEYDVERSGKHEIGKGWLIESTPSSAVLYDSLKNFVKLDEGMRILNLKPVRSGKKLLRPELQFTDIPFDSLQKLVAGKAILSLKLQATLPIEYLKENVPQTGTSISMDFLKSPIFKSVVVDSIDLQTAKDLELAKQELSQQNEQLRYWADEMKIYQLKKNAAYEVLKKLEHDLQSDDLAVKESAMRNIAKARADVETLESRKIRPVDQTQAIVTKMNFLRSKMRIQKQQSISGYIQYLQL